MTRLLIAVYLIEAGLLLMVAPWTAWWQRNYFADLLPWLRWSMAQPAVRLGVVATGVLTVLVGMSDLRDVLLRRFAGRTRRVPTPHEPDA
jgi:hypothetical protein